MGKPFTISIQGFNKLKNRIASSPAKLRKEIGGELKDSANRINAKQLRLLPVDEGGLKQGTIVKHTSDLEHDLLSSKRYAPFMEFGTKSKAVIPAELQEFAKQFNQSGPKMKFAEFLLLIAAWVRRKGIAGKYSVKTKRRLGGKATKDAEDTAVAYPIAVSILRKGVKPHPFFYAPYLEEKPKIIVRVKKILDDI
jgi:hypothetical protein